MLKKDKERIVAELTERLRASESLIVADYRGLSVAEIDELRTRLLDAGARFSVVKNTLTRRAAEAAGNEPLLELIDGPTAIAFIQPDGDPAAIAKVLSETAKTGRVLVIKGGLLEGRPIAEDEVENLAKLPALEVLRGQVLGAVVAPLNSIAALVNAPLQDLYGLLDARIEQLGGEEPEVEAEPVAETAAEPEPEAQAAPAEPEAANGDAEPEAEAAPEPESEPDAEPEAEAAEPAPEAEPEAAEPAAEPEAAAEPEPEAAGEPDATADAEPKAEAEPEAAADTEDQETEDAEAASDESEKEE